MAFKIQSVIYRKKRDDAELQKNVSDPIHTFFWWWQLRLSGLKIFFKRGSTCRFILFPEGGSDWRKVIVNECRQLKKLSKTGWLIISFLVFPWKAKTKASITLVMNKPKVCELLLKSQHKLYYHKLGNFSKKMMN